MKHAITALLLLALAAPALAMEPAQVKTAPAAPAAKAPAAAGKPAALKAEDVSTLQPAVQTSAATNAANTSAQDRLELDATQITGNRELPRVLYVVPWKRSDLGDLSGKPVNSLLDEVLAPVDRDVFRRQNRYYQALKPDSAGAGGKSSTEGEK